MVGSLNTLKKIETNYLQDKISGHFTVYVFTVLMYFERIFSNNYFKMPTFKPRLLRVSCVS